MILKLFCSKIFVFSLIINRIVVLKLVDQITAIREYLDNALETQMESESSNPDFSFNKIFIVKMDQLSMKTTKICPLLP